MVLFLKQIKTQKKQNSSSKEANSYMLITKPNKRCALGFTFLEALASLVVNITRVGFNEYSDLQLSGY